MEAFQGFQKIARLSRECVVTEKIDGTNAQVLIDDDGAVTAGSRTRYITPENDNFGFARWVREHEDELRTGLGPGRHYGEWWGAGIQRRYGLPEKRFSLFNVSRWTPDNVPACCDVVPVLYRGAFDTLTLQQVMADLQAEGSAAVPSFMNPEGIVIYHVAAGVYFKKTFEGDEAGKAYGA